MQVDALQMKYLAALDRRDLDAWLACFADEASYTCITRENSDANLPVALMLDDCRARLKDRVKFVNEVWSGTFEDYATRHFIQRFECTQAEDGGLSVLSNFMVSYTNRRGGSDILVTGVYEDAIGLRHEGACFRAKRAVLDTVTTPRYLVYPV
ncbi:MAG: anthranilate 1,2-dioxygenase small subunit [Alphaproteobacteria bacterium]|nr:anthranilate 1,2-dioxygenase small subunit [Alphaproteobacteria bacterium]